MNRRPYFSIFTFALVLCLTWAAFIQAGDKPKTLDTDPNLAGWWKFDETSGITAADSSKHNRKGTLKEGISFEKDSASGRAGRKKQEAKSYPGVWMISARCLHSVL